MKNRLTKALPSTASEAQKAADKFFAQKNEQVKSESHFVNQKIGPLFTNLRYQGGTLQVNPESNKPDHWQLIYQPYVSPSSEEKAVPIEDMQVRIMIGGGGLVTGMDYNMLPLYSTSTTKRYSQYLDKTIHPDTPIIYKTNTEKNIVSPYYLIPPQAKQDGSNLIASSDNSILPLTAFEESGVSYLPACAESVYRKIDIDDDIPKAGKELVDLDKDFPIDLEILKTIESMPITIYLKDRYGATINDSVKEA